MRFLEAGLTVLAEEGYAALKLASGCERADVMTGSFQHAFDSWADCTSPLIESLREEMSRPLIAEAREVADIHERLAFLMSRALALPHESAVAIRIWAATDREVYRHQSGVGRERCDVMR